MAHFGHAAISQLSLLSWVKRKLDFEPAKGSFWREAAVRAWDELATEDLDRPVDATHLQHDQLKLLKLSN